MDRDIQTLRGLVGDRAMRALRRGVPLQCWRRTTPYNWFIEGKRSGLLWHSDDRDRRIPNLALFWDALDSPELIAPSFLHCDGGRPELSLYVLREEYGGHGREVSRCQT